MSGGSKRNADAALVAALAGGCTIPEAASKAGVSERTAYRRLKDQDFAGQVRAARADMVSRAVGQLAEASTEATAALRRLLSAKSEMVRMLACRAVLELGTKLRESEELERRIGDLEAKLAASEKES